MTATQALPPLGDVAETVRTASAARDEFVRWIADQRRADFLYPADDSDDEESITVSAIAMMALNEVDHPTAQFTCDALLARTCGDGGSCSHVMEAAWVLSACLRVRPSCVEELMPVVRWLLEARGQVSIGGKDKSGWPLRSGGVVRAFYTGYALNALNEFVRYSRYPKPTPELQDLVGDVERVVRDSAMDLLALRLYRSGSETVLWSRTPGERPGCLASTAIALHALAKVSVSDRSMLTEPLQKTFRYLSEVMGTWPPASGQVNPPDRVEDDSIDAWPEIEEPDGQYRYRYYTPIMAVTLLDVARDLERGGSNLGEESGNAALQRAVLETVKWIGGSVRSIVPRGAVAQLPDERHAVWSNAQAAIVLNRWLRSAAYLLTQPQLLESLSESGRIWEASEIRKLPTVLPQYFKTIDDIRLLLQDADLDSSRYELQGSARAVWRGVLDKLRGDPWGLLGLLRVASEEKSGVQEFKDAIEILEEARP